MLKPSRSLLTPSLVLLFLKPTVILCHNPSEVVPMRDDWISVGTHDLFDDYYCNDAVDLIVIFPNISAIRKAVTQKEMLPFSFDCVFACHHNSDPVELTTEICSKFGTLHDYVVEVAFLAELKKKTYRSFATTAYRIKVSNIVSTGFTLTWKMPTNKLDEFLLAKAVAGDARVTEIANDTMGSLVCKTTKGNGCFDFEKGGNMVPLSFKPGDSSTCAYKKELSIFLQTCYEVSREMPSAVVQFRERIDWNQDKEQRLS